MPRSVSGIDTRSPTMAVAKHEMRQITLSRSLQTINTGQAGIAIMQTTEVTSAVIIERPGATKFTPQRQSLPASSRRPNSMDVTQDNSTKVSAPKEISKGPREKSVHIDVEPEKNAAESAPPEPKELDLKSSWLQRRYVTLCENIHQSEDLKTETKAENCTNFCCRAYDSCKRAYESPKMTSELTKSRTFGFQSVVDTVGSDIFTASPVGSIVREFVVYCGFLLMLVLCINIIVGYASDRSKNIEDEAFQICQLVLSLIGVLLAILDLAHHLVRHNCKTCRKKTVEVEWYNNTPNIFLLPKADGKGKCCRTGCAYERVDIIRFFVTPIITYPLLLLSMFEMLSRLILCRTDVPSSLSLALSIVIQFSLVYLVRIFVFAGTIYSIQKVRTGGESRKDLMKGSIFQHYFVVSAIWQMFVELLLIATIGVRFYYDYQAFSTNIFVRRPALFLPTGQLWYMMVFGYFASPIGMVLFFLSHYYWSQKFFIKFFVDALNVLKEKAYKESAYKDDLNASSKLNSSSELDSMKETSFGRKLIYPFLSPAIIFLCIAYCFSLIGFAVCTLLHSPAHGSNAIIGFYAAATVVTILTNLYPCIIAGLWIPVIIVNFLW